MLTQTGTTSNSYLYTGQRHDDLTGLYDLRARQYDPASGRFLSRDAWEIDYHYPLELNRYVYAAANPVLWRDPSGYAATFEQGTLRKIGKASAPILFNVGRQVGVQFVRITAALLQDLAGQMLLDWLHEQLGILDATDLLPRVLRYDDIISRVQDLVTDEVLDEIEKQLPLVVILGPGGNVREVLNIVAARPGHRFIVIEEGTGAISLGLDIDMPFMGIIQADFGNVDLGSDNGNVDEVFSVRPNPSSFPDVNNFVLRHLKPGGGRIYAAVNYSDSPGEFGVTLSGTVNWLVSNRKISQDDLIHGRNAVGIPFPTNRYDFSLDVGEFLGIR